jgi:hypothetical protein
MKNFLSAVAFAALLIPLAASGSQAEDMTPAQMFNRLMEEHKSDMESRQESTPGISDSDDSDSSSGSSSSSSESSSASDPAPSFSPSEESSSSSGSDSDSGSSSEGSGDSAPGVGPGYN